MHRPTARRPRRLAGALTALTALVAACADAAQPEPVVVEVAAQPCDRPTRSLGLGVVVADDLVATAAHTVEGPLRELTVDGAPATLVAIDVRTDLALLGTDLDAPAAELSIEPLEAGTVLDARVHVVRSGPLVVHDATDRARYERDVHVFTPGVAGGTSGAPLVDDDGRVAGLVVLDNRRDGVAYAVTAAELVALLAAPDRASPAIEPCAP